MDGREYADPLTDRALQRELERALAVDPSPEFAARVRIRVANAPMAKAWWSLRWQYVAAAACVCAAVAVVLVMGARPRRTDVPAVVAAAPAHTAVAAGTSHRESPTAIAEAPRVDVVSAVRRTTRSAVKSGDDLPEVIVPPGGEQAIRMFAAAAWARRVPVAAAATTAEDPLQIAPVDIPPLDIEPLPQMAALEGERP